MGIDLPYDEGEGVADIATEDLLELLLQFVLVFPGSSAREVDVLRESAAAGADDQGVAPQKEPGAVIVAEQAAVQQCEHELFAQLCS